MSELDANEIAAFIIQQGWFQAEAQISAKGQSWRQVTDADGNQGVLYIVRFHSTSEAGEPRRIPNEPDALQGIAQLHAGLTSPKVGPFLALAEVTEGPGLANPISVKVWNIAGKIEPGLKAIAVDDLRHPSYQWP